MSRLVYDIIKDAVSDGLGLPRDPIQSDVMAEAVSRYNKMGQVIWDNYLWRSRYIDQFDTDDATHVSNYDTDTGIITFTSIVNAVHAIRPVASDNTADYAMWPQDQVNAARNGETVESGRYIILSKDSSGLFRIQVPTDDNISKYRILADLRFVEATIEDSYDSGNESATPTDYRVLKWIVDPAIPALSAAVADELRSWEGVSTKGDWNALLQNAKDNETKLEPREQVFTPASPMFGDIGDWD